jgi:hypothetical protein
MVFRQEYNPNEKRVIRILAHDRDFSHQEIADWLNIFFRTYNSGTRKGRGVYGYLKREVRSNSISIL